MPTYTLEIEAIGNYLTDIPTLEIWNEGILHSSHSITSSGSTISLSLSFSGDIPSSLNFVFNDLLIEPNREIEILNVRINDRHVNTGNYLSESTLNEGDTAIVETNDGQFLFTPSEPDASEFTTGATQTYTTGDDTYRNYTETVDQVFNMLDGRDVAQMGLGNDKVSGGAGNDFLYGFDGADLLFGDVGDDRVYGGNDNDILYGGDGDDRVHGDAGDDEVHGGAGNDTITGNDGNDILTGGDGVDKLNGGEGDDFLFGDGGNDTLISSNGNDTLDGGAGIDLLRAGAGDDYLYGGDDRDVLEGSLGNDILHGGEGRDNLYGGHGNDILHGDSNSDYLLGNEDDDILYSSSSETLDATIAQILADNVGVSYNAATNSFYQFVATATSWDSASTAASAATLTGLTGENGHLLTISSQAENNLITSFSLPNDIWLNASDAGTEGEWIWQGGPEQDQLFWTGGTFGSENNNLYSNWPLFGPSDVSGTQDHAVLKVSGVWDSEESTNLNSYMIEWEADSLISFSTSTFLNGGTGVDQLYGSEGIDIFVFDNTDNIDTVFNFDAEGRDILDLRDIVSYDVANDDLTDFLQITENLGNTTLAVDIDGAANGSNFVDIATLDSVTGLDLQTLLAGDNLLMS